MKSKTMTSIFAIFALVAGTFMGLASAHINIGGDNGTTGANSENTNTWTLGDDGTVDVTNTSTLDNVQGFTLSSGLGDTSFNTEVGNIKTGDITGVVGSDNSLNSGELEMASSSTGDGKFDFSNDTTGSSSVNDNEATLTMTRDIDVNNTSHITNNLDLTASTGGFDISNNTEVGDVHTGNVDFTVKNNNHANANMSDVDMSHMDTPSVTGDFSNDTTGANSENTNTLNATSDLDVDITNHATITNTNTIDASTGGSDIGNNTVVGNITTGSVHLNLSSNNVAN